MPVMLRLAAPVVPPLPPEPVLFEPSLEERPAATATPAQFRGAAWGEGAWVSPFEEAKSTGALSVRLLGARRGATRYAAMDDIPAAETAAPFVDPSGRRNSLLSGRCRRGLRRRRCRFVPRRPGHRDAFGSRPGAPVGGGAGDRRGDDVDGGCRALLARGAGIGVGGAGSPVRRDAGAHRLPAHGRRTGPLRPLRRIDTVEVARPSPPAGCSGRAMLSLPANATALGFAAQRLSSTDTVNADIAASTGGSAASPSTPPAICGSSAPPSDNPPLARYPVAALDPIGRQGPGCNHRPGRVRARPGQPVGARLRPGGEPAGSPSRSQARW